MSIKDSESKTISTNVFNDIRSDSLAQNPLQPTPAQSVSTYSSETEARDSTSDEAGRIEQRRRLRAEARRQRVGNRLLALGLVLGPVLIAGFYLIFLATPRYAADSHFTVRNNNTQSSAAPTGLLSSGGGGGALGGLGGFVDGWAVQDFLNSRECMQELDRQVGLKKYFAHGGMDPLNHLGPHANEDALFAAYQIRVKNSYDLISQINGLKVSAYTPADAAFLSNALLAVASHFVNKMDQKGIDDALKVSRQNVETAEQKDRDALSALAAWRSKNGNVDPTADATMLLNQVGQIETDLTTAQVNLAKIRAMNNPNHPMLVPAELQVTALQRRLEQMRGQMSGSGNTEANQLKTYVELTNTQTFSDSNLLAARQAYQQAFTDAAKLERYLTVIALPVPDGVPSSPNVPLLLAEALAAGWVLAGIVFGGRAVYRSFRHA